MWPFEPCSFTRGPLFGLGSTVMPPGSWSTTLDSAPQRAKRRDAEQRAARLDRILSFFQHGDIVPDMSQRDVKLYKTVERKLRAWGQPREPPFA